MLKIEQLCAGYGASQVLHGLSLVVQPGEIVALLGRNGSGRSTTAKAIMGLVAAQGSVQWQGHEMLGKPVFEVAQHGIGYVAEGRDIFPRLTVHQNLRLGQKTALRGLARPGSWGFDDSYRLFPSLQARQHTEAGVLSGGEQQMLALCRTLMGNPGLVVIDEPTEGLSPAMVAQVQSLLVQLRARGLAVLLMAQKLALALAVSDRVLLMGHGRLVFEGTPALLQARADLRREWLEV